jgi:hypothetical protein
VRSFGYVVRFFLVFMRVDEFLELIRLPTPESCANTCSYADGWSLAELIGTDSSKQTYPLVMLVKWIHAQREILLHNSLSVELDLPSHRCVP